ncbi:hypothetical protein BJ322DRAFT_996776 [Thelephora terrestris]|uniref:NADAR domain-containing protein n=1 Tax=Thelephora terrestris TaxID=56493 RepID=A0A9P6LB02_9AGAM|nr:hypothetical protein BJ322DRAFT_996776 [Thelephora terrestris]
MPRSKTDYLFFWRPQDPNGWAGQWSRSAFTAPLSAAIPHASSTPHTFPTAEHWIMACKAALFSDTATLELILEETTKAETEPRDIKALGRKVACFDEDTWVEHREEIVYRGNLYKFGQNEELKEALLGTGDLILVEASPLDKIWGIGFTGDKAMENREKWGLNLLGIALMRVRGELAKKEQDSGTEAKL